MSENNLPTSVDSPLLRSPTGRLPLSERNNANANSPSMTKSPPRASEKGSNSPAVVVKSPVPAAPKEEVIPKVVDPESRHASGRLSGLVRAAAVWQEMIERE